MLESSANANDDIARALAALKKIENAGEFGSVRRTAAESDSAAGEAATQLARIEAENADLKQQLAQAREEQAALQKRAGGLVQQVDKALDRLDQIEKG